VVKLGTGAEATILSTIPLFIFAGFLMAEAKTADRVVKASQAALGWLPGGLAMVTIIACAIFTTFTGASGVTIVALGGLLMPALLKERYPQRFSLGLVAGTGSVGLLFPPAVPLFVYGTVYGFTMQAAAATESAGEMQLIDFETNRFIFAGIVPGMILLGILMIFAAIVAIKVKVPRKPFAAAEFGRAALIALPELIIPFGIIFLIINGVGIPECAALTVVYVLLLETLVYRDVPLRALWRLVRESMALVGAIFIIIFAAQAFTAFLVMADVPQTLVAWIVDNFDSKWTFLIGLNLLLIVVGMVMDIFSAIVVVVPLIAPAAKLMGIDPYHLGVIFLLNLEIGYLTPPVGLNLFITGFTFRRPIMEVVRASLPFLGCMIVALILITYIPALTIVPDKERRGQVTEFARQVKVAYQEVTSVQELTLPDGTVKRLAECEEITDSMGREDCKGLFLDVTRCRAAADGASDSSCERDAIASYAERIAEAGDDGWDDDDDAGDGDGGDGGDDGEDGEADEDDAADDGAGEDDASAGGDDE
jgi:C4-dicarboxylate transporter, DctM subunit